MALSFLDNVDYRGKKPNFTRDLFVDIATMAAFNENYLPNVFMACNEEDGQPYIFNRDNAVDETLGKWRPIEGGTGGSVSWDTLIGKPFKDIDGNTFAVDENGILSIVIPISAEEGNQIKTKADGLYVPAYDDTALVQRISDIESDYAKLSDIPSLSGYATETWVNEQGFLTQHQDLSNYATKDELPSLDGYATESYVTEQISNIPSVDLTDYAKKNEIPDVSGYITEEQLLAKDYADKAYVTEEIAKASTGSEIDLSAYLSKVEATETYVTKESGKSLIADTEIERLASVDNYDDTEIDNRIRAIEDDYIKNTDLAAVAKSGSYNDLIDTPSIPSIEGLAKTEDIPTKVSELENDSNYLSSIPEEYVTDTELEEKGYLTEHQDISNLVEKEDGKGLSSNDYTTEEKNKLESLENYDDSALTEKVQVIEDDYLTSVQKEELVNSIAELDTKITDGLEEKLDAVQSVDNAGKFLVVGDDGTVTFAEPSAASGDSAENIAYVNADYSQYSNVDLALDALFAKVYYVKPTCSLSASPTGGTFEMGTVITAPIVFNWTTNKPITSQTLTGFTLENTEVRTATYETDISTDKTFTLSVSDGENNASSSVSYKFMNNVFWGSAAAADTYDSAFINALSNKKLTTSVKGTYSFNVADGEYGFWAVPSNMTISTVWIGGFEVTVDDLGTVSYTNAQGYTRDYKLYKTGKASLGVISAEIK